MIVELHEDAATELEEAAAWYETRRKGLGDAFTHEIMAAAAKIAELPEAWPPWPTSAEFRVVRVRRFPYHLPYAIREDRAIVMAVAHDKRRRGYWLEDRSL